MIDIINDNFNDLAKDYYELQEEYENVLIANRKLIKEIDDYQNIIIKMKEQNQQLKERIDNAIKILNKLNIKLKDILQIGIDIKEISVIKQILGDKE